MSFSSELVSPEILKKYPYFMEWLKELNRLPEDVLNFAIQTEMKEVASEDRWKKYKPTDNFTVSLTFKNGEYVSRHGKWSEGKMMYLSEVKS